MRIVRMSILSLVIASFAACGGKKAEETTPAPAESTEANPCAGGEAANPCAGGEAANPCAGGEANPCAGGM